LKSGLLSIYLKFEALNEHGIKIPFPQRDLHIKEWPEALAKKGEGQA
jgi:small-conductance mechanosensitive channel